ncbi:DUF89 family protein [Candidatus Bathyarchaeota archaeon]|nr:DUF89 family protein [Candidatus Bathyarchaeota archaeon]
MKVHLECVPCFLRQALEAAKMSTDDEMVCEKALRGVMTYLLNEQWTKIIPELGTNVHRIVKRITGNMDPYKQLKEKYNQIALELYPKLELIVDNSKDPLLTAVKLAIAGNVIDFGPRVDINLKKEVQNVLDKELVINDIEQLKRGVLKSKSLLYLADNAGETFFDRILIEAFLKRRVKVTYVVKDAPILNDATFRDAEIAGISHMTKVMSIGTDCTGVLFKECSNEFLSEFESSSLVISKGQGNYESLSDVKNKEIFFLLKIKCPIIADSIGAEAGSIVLKRTFNKDRNNFASAEKLL